MKYLLDENEFQQKQKEWAKKGFEECIRRLQFTVHNETLFMPNNGQIDKKEMDAFKVLSQDLIRLAKSNKAFKTRFTKGIK